MSFDDHLSDLMTRAVATVDPPVAPMIDGGTARGRRLVRRRRAGYGLSVAAVAGGLAVVVAVATAGSGGTPRSTGGGGAPAAHSGTSTTKSSIQARERLAAERQLRLVQQRARAQARAAQRVTDAAAAESMTPQALLQATLDLLPAGGTTSQYGGSADQGYTGARFVWDDGQGAAQVEVALIYPTDGPKGEQTEAPCVAGHAHCTVLPDGAHVLTRQGTQYRDGRQPNATEWDLDLVRPDGTEVTFIEWNAPAPKDVAPTRAEPPFTLQQLTTWADSSAYRTQVSAAQAHAAKHLFTPDTVTAPR